MEAQLRIGPTVTPSACISITIWKLEIRLYYNLANGSPFMGQKCGVLAIMNSTGRGVEKRRYLVC